MSAIDQYKHNLLGFIDCPSEYSFVENNTTRYIAIYELLEDIPENEKCFDGKKGDILLGGGNGEAKAFRISFPNCFYFFGSEGWDEFESYDEIFKPFWDNTTAYIFCDGYKKLGWELDNKIEFWLAENLCILLINEIEKFRIVNIKSTKKSKLNFIK